MARLREALERETALRKEAQAEAREAVTINILTISVGGHSFAVNPHLLTWVVLPSTKLS